MRPLAGLLAGACAAAVIACAGASSRSQAPTSATAMPEAGAAPLDRHAELDALDRAIAADLEKLGLPPPAPPACAAVGCASVTPTPMGVTPAAADPTCQAGTSDTCKDACTLSDAICANAGRICDLATQLGGDDARANETCERGKASCTVSRTRCCGCL